MQKHPALPAEPPQVFDLHRPSTHRQAAPSCTARITCSRAPSQRITHLCGSDSCATTQRVGCILKWMKHIYKPWFRPQPLLPESPGWLRIDNGFLFSFYTGGGSNKPWSYKGATNKDILDIPSMKRTWNITSHCQLGVIFMDQTRLQNSMVRNKGFLSSEKADWKQK